jgi:hypothetical protein
MSFSYFHICSIIGVAFVLLTWFAIVRRTSTYLIPNYRFSKKKLLAEYERRFFAQLCREVPGYLVFPRVNMCALVEPDYLMRDPRRREALSMIAQRRADFVICNADFGVEFIVELVDGSNEFVRDRRRNPQDAAMGYKTIRIKNTLVFDFTDVHNMIPGQAVEFDRHLVLADL